MNLPINIVRKYTKLPDTKEVLTKIISEKIGEIESITDYSAIYEGIVVAQITQANDHPDADKLKVYMVNTGEEEDIQVVAGDKGIKVGSKVAYIKPGNTVPSTAMTSEPFTIKAVKMRGVLSNGMLCSQRELDIGGDHSKVYILDENAKVGQPFAEYFEFNDTVINIENKALTNRGDLFGILGLAREISGAQNIRFESPLWYKEIESNTEIGDNDIFDVDNQADSLCKRYCAIAIDNIEVTSSPVWLQSFLLKSGVRPINNVVDITNYLMLLTGQPLHAFDLDKIIKNDNPKSKKAHIVIRMAKDGEKMHALDGNVYELNSRNLVISNSQFPIALAGIIGGQDTEIDTNTKRVIIESANFDKYNLRKTSMELGIVTDSSTRFTRAQDVEKCDNIALHALSLIEELAKGSRMTPLIDSYPQKKDENIKSVNLEKLISRLGIGLRKKEVVDILGNIEYEYINSEKDHITFKVPSFRNDIEIEEDIYEDIIRIYGYENIDHILPKREIFSVSKPSLFKLKSKIREILSNSGCNELITYNFVSKESLSNVKQDPNNCLHIKNPQSKHLDFMRPSILTTLIEKAHLNTQEGVESFGIYEIGLGHLKDILDNEELPLEEWKLALVFSDSTKSIDGNPYFEAKRYFEKLLSSLKVETPRYSLLSEINIEDLPEWIRNIAHTFELNSSAVVSTQIGDSELYLGILGEINNEVKKNLNLNNYTCAFEMNIELLEQLLGSRVVEYKGSKFPSITQDICFVCPSTLEYKDLEENVYKSIKFRDGEIDIQCIDIYQKNDGEEKRITLRISVTHTQRTLTLNDFKEYRKKIEKQISKIDVSMI